MGKITITIDKQCIDSEVDDLISYNRNMFILHCMENNISPTVENFRLFLKIIA